MLEGQSSSRQPEIYPDNGPNLEDDKGRNPEQLESRNVAREKLELLMSDDFTNYGVRFVNIDEYEAMLTNHVLPSGGEISAPALISKHPQRFVFKDWLASLVAYSSLDYMNASTDMDPFKSKTYEAKGGNRSSGVGWAGTIKEMTDWFYSTKSVESYEDLLWYLHKAHKVAQEDSVDRESLRSKTMEHFKSYLLEKYKNLFNLIENIPSFSAAENRLNEIIGKENASQLIKNAVGLDRYPYITRPVDNFIKDYFDGESITPELKEEAKKIIELIFEFKHERIERRFSHEEIELILGFLNDPNYLDIPINLRRLLKALAYDPTKQSFSEVKGWGDKRAHQYHLACILSGDVLSPEPSEYPDHPEWRYIGRPDEQRSPEQNLLGVVTIMPDKELYQKIIQQVSNEGNWAHPVFDNHGIVRYPS